MPRAGDRIQESGLDKWMEWDGEAWTAVCPFDDVALTPRDGDGQWVCPVCERPWRDIVAEKWPRTYR